MTPSQKRGERVAPLRRIPARPSECFPPTSPPLGTQPVPHVPAPLDSAHLFRRLWTSLFLRPSDRHASRCLVPHRTGKDPGSRGGGVGSRCGQLSAPAPAKCRTVQLGGEPQPGTRGPSFDILFVRLIPPPTFNPFWGGGGRGSTFWIPILGKRFLLFCEEGLPARLV